MGRNIETSRSLPADGAAGWRRPAPASAGRGRLALAREAGARRAAHRAGPAALAELHRRRAAADSRGQPWTATDNGGRLRTRVDNGGQRRGRSSKDLNRALSGLERALTGRNYATEGAPSVPKASLSDTWRRAPLGPRSGLARCACGARRAAPLVRAPTIIGPGRKTAPISCLASDHQCAALDLGRRPRAPGSTGSTSTSGAAARAPTSGPNCLGLQAIRAPGLIARGGTPPAR